MLKTEGTESAKAAIRQDTPEAEDPFVKYACFNEALAALVSLDTTEAVYAHVLRSLEQFLHVVGGQVVEWDGNNGRYETVWKSGDLPAAAQLAGSLGDALETCRQDNCPRVYLAEDSDLRARGARSLIVAPLPIAPLGLFRSFLVWTALEEVPRHGMFSTMLRTLACVAAQSLATTALQQRFRQHREVLEEVVESVPFGILAVSKADLILSCNRNTEFIFRFNRRDVLGRRFPEVMPQALCDAIRCLIGAFTQGEVVLDHEFSYAVDSRTRLRIGISLAPILDRENAPAGFVFILRDLSLTREVQQLREMHRMDLEFVHTVCHEIRVPLTSILMASGLLRLDHERLDTEQIQSLTLVEESAKRLQELANDLLDLARLESGHTALELEEADLGKLLDEAIRSPRNTHDVTVTLRDKLPKVHLDRKKIRRAVDNLLSNAVKYSTEREPVRVEAWTEGDEVKISVSDRGVGIPPEQLPYVWDKFYRVSSQATAKISGTGLGLAIVKHIVGLHGGMVFVESVVGKGSSFGFSLPLNSVRPV